MEQQRGESRLAESGNQGEAIREAVNPQRPTVPRSSATGTAEDGRRLDEVTHVLVMTAVEAERDAVLRGIGGDPRFEVRLAGVGPALAAARTARAIAEARQVGDQRGYTLVVSAGIGGGFAAADAALGTIVVADSIVAGDLGVETAEGFVAVDELGFGSSVISAAAEPAGRLVRALEAAGLPAVLGPVVTVSTATGTAATAAARAQRAPEWAAAVAAEAMEGFGVAAAAADAGLPVLELRTVSNAVGPRDRSAWQIPQALQRLEAAFSILTKVV